MALVRFGLAVAFALALAGCETGAPQRASDIQNLHGISDDIAAVSMTESQTRRANDPNLPRLFPHAYETSYTP